jgi:hypothetical protein
MGRSLMVSLVFFAIFVAGIITGGFFMARWVRINQAHWQKMNQQQQQNIVVPIGPMMVKQMLNQLDLSRDQRRASNRILMESATVVRVLRNETDLALDRMQDEIDKVLTPDQRAKLGQLKDDQRVRLLEQREAVQGFLRQRRNAEATPASAAAPASGGNAQPPPSAAATQTQPAPVAPVATQSQPAPAQ